MPKTAQITGYNSKDLTVKIQTSLTGQGIGNINQGSNNLITMTQTEYNTNFATLFANASAAAGNPVAFATALSALLAQLATRQQAGAKIGVDFFNLKSTSSGGAPNPNAPLGQDVPIPTGIDQNTKNVWAPFGVTFNVASYDYTQAEEDEGLVVFLIYTSDNQTYAANLSNVKLTYYSNNYSATPPPVSPIVFTGLVKSRNNNLLILLGIITVGGLLLMKNRNNKKNNKKNKKKNN